MQVVVRPHGIATYYRSVQSLNPSTADYCRDWLKEMPVTLSTKEAVTGNRRLGFLSKSYVSHLASSPSYYLLLCFFSMHFLSQHLNLSHKQNSN